MALEFVRRGSGHPLLLIQGLSGTVHTWGEPFLRELEKTFDVVVYNHRGVGKSPRVEKDFSIAELADDAAALLADIGWPSANVLGISMGGMVAQELVLRHPERVKALVLGCTYCGGPRGRLTPQPTLQRLMMAGASGDRELAIRTGYEINLSPGFRAEESAYGAFREMVLARPVHASVVMRQMQAVMGHDTSARLPGVQHGTLVIHGTADAMLPYENGELIASLIPGAKLARLDGVGHLFWWEMPAKSAEIIAAHIRDS